MKTEKYLLKSITPRLAVMAILLCFGLLGGCKKSDNVSVPGDFKDFPLDKKMEFIMSKATPDSVARFVINASLGKIDGVELDLAEANLYALEHYRNKEADEYSTEYQAYPQKLPLLDKMNFNYMEAFLDSGQVGYHLGLEYLTYVRENNKNVKNVRDEIREFKEILGSDTATYRRFMMGFKYALKNDRGVDLDEDIYNEFINYDDTIK